MESVYDRYINHKGLEMNDRGWTPVKAERKNRD